MKSGKCPEKDLMAIKAGLLLVLTVLYNECRRLIWKELRSYELTPQFADQGDEPLAIGILFDITGAFDHLRWNSIIAELIE